MYPCQGIIHFTMLYFVCQGIIIRNLQGMVKRKDGLWQDKLVVNGQTRYFYGRTKKEVTEKIKSFNRMIIKSNDFDMIAEEWWYSLDGKLEYNTIEGYRAAYKRAREAFEGIPASEILPVNITRELRQMTRTYATKTIKNQLLVYRLIFRYAVEQGYIMQNPARDISVPEGTDTEDVCAPSNSDIEAIKANVESDPFGLFAYLAAYTGLRRGELLALRWEDVDIKNRVINVNKSVFFDSNVPKIKAPKTKTSVGQVPILDALYDILKKLKKKGYVFADVNGALLSKSSFAALWNNYRKRTGVQCTVHQLRHLYATMLFENDVQPEKAQHLLRHAQLSTTMNVYTHLRENKKNEIFESVYSVSLR